LENPCKIVFFGDSIAKGCFPHFKKALNKKYCDFDVSFENMGISGETTRDGLRHINKVLESKPQVVVIFFGMNDWRKEVGLKEFRSNITKIIEKIKSTKARPILTTIIPDWNGNTYDFSQPKLKGTTKIIDEYNKVIVEVMRAQRSRIADVNAKWKREIQPIYKGLLDAIHPNTNGYELITESLMHVVPRRNTTILWQYNGRYAYCNYNCPYCYVPTSVNKEVHYEKGSAEKWAKAFKECMGDQHLTFYFSYGEPTLGGADRKGLYETLEVIAKEPNWEVMMTSNLSIKFDKLINTQIAKEGRLNINASFHPTQVSADKFLEKLLFLRENGIECPVIYVMWPVPLGKHFESYPGESQLDAAERFFSIFDKYNFVFHVRAFRGLYKYKKYPKAYTDKEWVKVAKYMDKASLKYMLNEVNSLGRLSYTGMHHFLVNEKGNVEMCDAYAGDGRYGNIFDGKLNLDLEPQPFPGPVPLAAVDDVANYVELDYKELEGNHVISYAAQGRVYKAPETGKVHYPYINADLHDKNFQERISIVPDVSEQKNKFKTDLRWILEHFLVSFIIKKYLKYILAAIKGKYRLFKKGKLGITKKFWHS
jgi:lysophospholipase L1-like esterase